MTSFPQNSPVRCAAHRTQTTKHQTTTPVNRQAETIRSEASGRRATTQSPKATRRTKPTPKHQTSGTSTTTTQRTRQGISNASEIPKAGVEQTDPAMQVRRRRWGAQRKLDRRNDAPQQSTQHKAPPSTKHERAIARQRADTHRTTASDEGKQALGHIAPDAHTTKQDASNEPCKSA